MLAAAIGALSCVSHADFALDAPSFGYASGILDESVVSVPSSGLAWPGAPFGSLRALDTLAILVDLTDLELPRFEVLPKVCSSPTAVGCYDGSTISIVNG